MHPSPTSGEGETEGICVTEHSNKQNKVLPLLLWPVEGQCLAVCRHSLAPKAGEAPAGSREAGGA